MQIEGVPDSVPWDQVAKFLTGLGIDLTEVTRGEDDAAVVSIGWECIRLTVFAKDAEGHQYVDFGTDTLATHDIRIPVLHRPVVVLAVDGKDAEQFVARHLPDAEVVIGTPRSMGRVRGVRASEVVVTPAAAEHSSLPAMREVADPCVVT